MKGLINRIKSNRLLAIGVILGLLTLVAAGGVLAQTLLTQHNTVDIVLSGGGGGGGVPPTPNLALYSDAGANTILGNPFHWGQVNVGGNVTKTYYVKNIGTASANVTVSAPTIDFGTVTVNVASFNLAAGAVQQVDVTLSVSPTATAGTGKAFDVGFSY